MQTNWLQSGRCMRFWKKMKNEAPWMDYDTAKQRLQYDSNKVALWELDNKIRLGMI